MSARGLTKNETKKINDDCCRQLDHSCGSEAETAHEARVKKTRQTDSAWRPHTPTSSRCCSWRVTLAPAPSSLLLPPQAVALWQRTSSAGALTWSAPLSTPPPMQGLDSAEAEAAPPSLLTKRPLTRGRAVALRCRHRYTSCLARRILARFARNLRESAADRESGGGFASL